MAVEEHPMFEEWKKALERLITAKEGLKQGVASQADVDAAMKAYHDIADKV